MRAASVSTSISRLRSTLGAFMPLNAYPLKSKFDYIVVGAGSAGCVVASRLSEDPNVNVLLVEAGRQDNHPFLHIPVLYFKSIGDSRFDWKFKVEKETSGLNGRSITWPRGRCLGGSSAINGMLYVRGQPQDYDAWAVENPGWGWNDVLPLFKKAEDNEAFSDSGFESHLHGRGGPQGVSNGRIHTEIADRFIQATSEELGIPILQDMNGSKIEGVGYFQQITHVIGIWPFRCSSATGYLHGVRRKRPNLQILCNVEIEKILMEESGQGLKATGLLGSHEGNPLELGLESGGELILSSGALGSPHILMRSGVGRPDMLKNAGIEVRHALSGMGANLQDHLQVRAKFGVDAPTLNTQTEGVYNQTMAALDYAFRGCGPATMAASQVCAFFKSRPEVETPDLQFHFQPLSTSGSPAIHLDKQNAYTASICQLRPESRGYLELLPDKSLAIHADYLSHEVDQRCVVDGVRASQRIAQRLQDLDVHELAPGQGIESDEDTLNWCRDTAETIYHPTGTCKMGPAKDSEAVVDSRLRVHGVPNVRVADCSIMPTLVSGNTHAPAQVIGERCAQMLVEDRT